MATVDTVTTPTRTERWLLVAIVLGALAWSGIAPHDRLTWMLEVVWVVVGLPLVAWTWGRFPLTRLLSWLLVLHAVILIYGGAYTYALTPLGLWVAGSRSTWRATTTTASATSPRASSRPSWPANCCCGARRCSAAAGCSTWCWRRRCRSAPSSS